MSPVATPICSHITTTKIYFSFCDCKFNCIGACDTPLERYFQKNSNGMMSPRIPKVSIGKSRKNKSAVVKRLQSMMVQRTAMGKRLRFFFTMFSTSGKVVRDKAKHVGSILLRVLCKCFGVFGLWENII